MKRALTLCALFAVLGLVSFGCKPKKSGDGKAAAGNMPAAMDQDMATDTMAPDPMAKDMQPAAMAKDMQVAPAMAGMKAGGIAPFKIKECDDYIRIWTCYLKKLPVAQQGPTKDVFMKSITTWRKMATGPAKSSLGSSCKAAFDGWKKAIEKQKKFASCFGK